MGDQASANVTLISCVAYGEKRVLRRQNPIRTPFPQLEQVISNEMKLHIFQRHEVQLTLK